MVNSGTEELPFVKESRETSLPGGYDALFVVLCSCTGVCVLAAVAWGVVGRKILAPVLFVLTLWATLVSVTLMTWGLTYQASRDVIHDNIEELLSTTVLLSQAVQVDLTIGTTALHSFADAVADGRISLTAPYPDNQLILHSLFKNTATLSTSIASFYYGTSEGNSLGIDINGNIWFDPRNADSLPPHVVCQSFSDNPGENNCSEYKIAELCGSGALDLPCAATCRIVSRDVCSLGGLGFTKGKHYPGGFDLRTSPAWVMNFDPSKRPWYKYTENVTWSEPYTFLGGTAGFTSTIGLKYAGNFVGVVAADFTLKTVSKILRSILPSERSSILMLDENGMLLSSSLSPEALMVAIGSNSSKGLINVFDIHDPKSAVKEPILVVLKRFQTIKGGMAQKAMLQCAAGVVLSFPIFVPGFVTLLVATLPTVDIEKILEPADSASDRALGMGLGITCVIGFVVFVLILVLLRPVRRLAVDMDSVADLRLNAITKRHSSVIFEIDWMQQSFKQMVENLAEYRRYLPEDILRGIGEDLEDAERETVELAVVFTDIKSSTPIWELSPDGMRKALKIHNQIVRACIHQFGGYEVKTIGDSFMITFSELSSAILFSLKVHVDLLNATWPEELLVLDLCRRTDDGLWGGLCVRIGVHYGECHVDHAPSGGIDYLGQCVIRASRLEGICAGGAVCISEEIISQIPDLAAVGDPHIVSSDSHHLKGMREYVNALMLVPQELAGRGGDMDATESVNEQSFAQSMSASTSSNVSSTSQSQSRRPVKERLKDSLVHMPSAVIAHVEYRFKSSAFHDPEDPVVRVNEAAQHILGTLSTTLGALVAFVGQCVIASWNASRPYHSPLGASAKFVSDLYSNQHRNQEQCFCGLSCGRVLVGSVGAGGLKYMTTLGSPLALAAMLSQAAMSLETFALCSPTTGQMSYGSRMATRPVDEWTVGERKLVLHQMDPTSARCSTPVYNPLEHEAWEWKEDPNEWGWSAKYITAFKEKDYKKIATSITVEDKVAEQVVRMLKSGTHLRTDLSAMFLDMH